MGGRADGKGVLESAEETCSLTWPKVVTDYHGALLRLATMRAAEKQYLIFGYGELFPRDIPLPESFTAGEKLWTVPGSSGAVTLAASALAMTVAEWTGHIPRSGTPVDLAAPPFGVDQALGRFCVGETVPFAPRWHDGPRIHRLVPMEEPDQAAGGFVARLFPLEMHSKSCEEPSRSDSWR